MAASNQVRQVDRILHGHAMAGTGRWFVYYSQAYHVDLGLLLGIAGAETTWGDAGTGQPGSGYGAFGVGPKVRYGGYRQAIAAAAKLLKTGYRQWSKPGSANAAGMAPKWVGYSSADWVSTASHYANMFGSKQGKAGRGGGALPKGTYVRPVPTNMGSSDFSYVDAEGAPDRNGVRHHAAHDWFGKEGGLTPVFAPISGKVIESRQATTWTGQVMGGTIKIQAANGMVFVFRHVIPGLKEGMTVRAGKQIARIGKWTDGPDHTHVEIWKTLAGGYHYENMIDPVKFFTDHHTVSWKEAGTAPAGSFDGGNASNPSGQAGAELRYSPHYTTDLSMSGSLGHPGQDPITDVGPQPGSVLRMWQSLANLPNPSAETLTFADRANMWGGN